MRMFVQNNRMKFYCAAFALLMILSGCSNDENGSSAVLLRKLVQTSNGEDFTATYHYDGNRLDYIEIGQDEVIDYTYSGNLISEISYEDYDGEVYQRTLFYYENGLLVKNVTTRPFQDFVYEAEYFYNPDSTVDFTTMSTNWDGSFTAGNPGKYFFDTQGNLVRIEQYGQSGTSVVQYGYDQHLNPFNNIEGMARLMEFNSGPHNVISIDGTSPRTYEYTYNSAGYPVSATVESSDGLQSVSYVY